MYRGAAKNKEQARADQVAMMLYVNSKGSCRYRVDTIGNAP